MPRPAGAQQMFQQAKMANARSSRTTRLGVSQETLNEIQGVVILFLALASILSIASANRPSNLIGPVGAFLARALVFALGQVVVYGVPAILLVWGVTRFCGIVWSYAVLKIFGLLLLMIAGCGLLAQTGYDLMRFVESQAERDYVSFRWGGALGGFLISADGIDLPRHLGRTGTYLSLSAAGAVGLLLATNFLFYSFFQGIWRHVHHGHAAISGRLHRLTEKREARKFERESRRKARGALFERRQAGRVLGNGDGDENADAPPSEPQRELPSLAAPSQIGYEAAEEVEAGDEDEAEEVEAISPQQLDFFEGYRLPRLDLLATPPPANDPLSQADVDALSRTIEEKLASFGIKVRVTQVTQGPVVTLFELRPAAGVKINRIVTLENDLAMALHANRLRILAPIPGRGTVGIETPNPKAQIVRLREILDARDFQSSDAPLMFGVGKTIDGRPYVCNLAKMPHMLIAGATGSGKSVCLNAIICSFLLRNPPDRVRFIMIDPKRVEMSIFRKIPHLLAPVVSEPRKCAAALAWVVGQMEDRYRRLAEMGVRGIDAYNNLANDPERALEKHGRELPYMPHIVIFVDELADLMLIARNEVEENVIRLAQMSRAVGIHLVIATQRPSVNVITGIIKANFPCRIAFQVSSKVDSRTILDMNGAEALLGQGDMLFSAGGSMRPIRLQGAFVSDNEVERLVEFITAQGEVAGEEQLEAERAIEDVEQRAATAAAKSASVAEAEVAEDDGGGEGPRSIDDAERVLGHERDQKPVRVQYAVEDFTLPDDREDEMSDELYGKALRLILESRKASVSLMQRRMKIGYARAGRLMDIMEDRGIVGPYQGSKPRQILVDPVEYLQKLESGTA